ncbi:hypothetical protein [Streptomyces sp. NPDC050738]|uniref:hypothetical protein n=1 Tax=Streptomyces sp. NPDC050738 TaxID=3154744 RepID=UPI003415F6DD
MVPRTVGEKAWVRPEPSDACPVPPGHQEWIETWMRWCVKEFGTAPLRKAVALPGPELLPVGFEASQEQTEQLVRRVGAIMGADPDGITISLFESAPDDARSPLSSRDRHRTVGLYRKVDGRAQIELDIREAEEPPVFAAVIAHELGHARLLGENRIEGLSVDGELLTDLVTVYLGMGVFTANAAYHFTKASQGFSVVPLGDLTDRMLTGTRDASQRLGYLTDRQFGYALAYYSVLRGELDPAWAGHLNAGVRVVLRQGLRHLASRPRVRRDALPE